MEVQSHPTIEETIEFMKFAHAGQVDKSGEEYWKHPYTVYEAVKELGASEDALHAALLHDVLEDTDVTAMTLRELGYNADVCLIVSYLTRTTSVVSTYRKYIDNIARNAKRGDKRAIAAATIKLADLQHNLDPQRLYSIEGSVDGLVKRYKLAFDTLDAALFEAEKAGYL